jgi:hypothetical protein
MCFSSFKIRFFSFSPPFFNFVRISSVRHCLRNWGFVSDFYFQQKNLLDKLSDTVFNTVTESLVTKYHTTESQMTESQMTESQMTESQMTEFQMTESQMTESQMTESQMTKYNLTESQMTESH